MSNWRRGQYKHFFRQILWHAPSMAARPVTSWGRCQPATASPFLCLWLDYSCQLVSVLIEAQLVWKSANLLSWRRSCTIGSTVMVITALTTIAQQLISDCKHYGIEALSSKQASGRFNQWEINFHPVCHCIALTLILELGCGRHPLKSRKFNSQNEFKCLEPLYQANSSKFILGSSTKLIAISHNCTVYTFWSHIEKRCTETVNIYNNFFPLFVDCYSACLKGRILQCSFALQFCNLVSKYSLGYSFATSISGCQLGSERVSTIYTAQKTNKAMLNYLLCL